MRVCACRWGPRRVGGGARTRSTMSMRSCPSLRVCHTLTHLLPISNLSSLGLSAFFIGHRTHSPGTIKSGQAEPLVHAENKTHQRGVWQYRGKEHH